MADLLNKVGVGLGALGAGVNAVSGLLGLGADGGQSKFAVSKLTCLFRNVYLVSMMHQIWKQ